MKPLFVPTAAAIGALLVASCNRPRYHYEPAPPSPPPASEPARCYETQRLALTVAGFSYSRSVQTTAETYRVERYGDRGLVLYAGDRRLGAVEALEAIGEAELERGYRAVLDDTASAYRWNPVAQTASLVTGGVATVAVLGGALWLVSSPDDARPAYLLLGGLGFGLVSLTATLVNYLTQVPAARHQRDQRMIADPRLARQVAAAAARHNRRLAQRCGHPPDLPMTDRVRRTYAGPPGN